MHATLNWKQRLCKTPPKENLYILVNFGTSYMVPDVDLKLGIGVTVFIGINSSLRYRLLRRNAFIEITSQVFGVRLPVLGYTRRRRNASIKQDLHYGDVIMSAMATQITGISIVCSLNVPLGADKIKYQSSASLAFVRGMHRWPVDSSQKGPVTRKMFPFDDVIMITPRGKVYMYLLVFVELYHAYNIIIPFSGISTPSLTDLADERFFSFFI